MEVTEIFYSLQGEGKEIGRPTVFIRTSGCNLRCEWCDTQYAWGRGSRMQVSEVLKKVKGFPIKRYCVTGGEPMLQKDAMELIDRLADMGDVSVETNGSIDITPLVSAKAMISMDYKTPSSGMESRMLDDNLSLLNKNDQIKFVIADLDDYDFALDIIDENDIAAEIIFQPEGSSPVKTLAERVVKDGLDVRVLPQLHKNIWGDKKGV